MNDTLRHVRVRAAARKALSALEMLANDPENDELPMVLNGAMIALRSALPEAAQ